ncbi:NAD(P)/FAD-dependent oxidoreductase [Streptomyces albireticuli]|uniref:Oxidoreductase n=1 Tax=Streptomyces albireticuli TaxID=1940 RepID=A0A2A2D6F8_9ACTN|nr:FAD-dependent oxidoreductase [Streptomyces albireticuli]MCD9195164.1 FAD-dependent oxidoreductase [Streptomyces albireticuli]PAU47026.1 oxidoreductase [Streptomyces albireticuli]
MSSHRGTDGVVIAGAGVAGAQTAVALRERGYGGPVVIVGAEPHRPYDRPALSKGVLMGTAQDPAYDIDFDALDVELRLGVEVTGLHPRTRTLDTTAGPVPYRTLVLATGAEPVPLPGADGVHLLRTLTDARRLRSVLAERRDVVVVGAGWIGAELTGVARASGCAVTVVEAADRPLAGSLPAEATAPMADWYAQAGAELLLGARVSAYERGAVVLADGRRLTTDAVVAGVGARPATAWLAGSGIALGPDGSVTADDRLRTSLPDVYAVGDCASFPSARFGTRLLVHHWDNALHGPRTVAAGITGGAPDPYDPVPYFWSEQFGRHVQYAGHHAAADTVVRRGKSTDTEWAVLWLRDGVPVALLTVNRPRDLAQGRKLIGVGARVDAARAADPSVPLKATVIAPARAQGPGEGPARPDSTFRADQVFSGQSL